MEPATAALIARAAIAAGTNKKCGQGLPLYWQPCAFRSSLPSCATSALPPAEQNITGRQCIWHSMEGRHRMECLQIIRLMSARCRKVCRAGCHIR